MTVKPRTNFILDMIILGLLLVVFVSGLLLWQVYPDGGTHYRGGRGEIGSSQAVIGLVRSDMRELHNWSGVLMGVLVVVHLLFHWKWLVCQTKRLLGLPTHARRGPAERNGCAE